MTQKLHYLIIGSGVAGVSLAVKISEKFPDRNIVIATKSNEEESNTKYAQGGIAVVTHSEDSYKKHIEDTLKCGDGLCDPEVVEMVVKDGADRLIELIEWGAEFDKNEQGKFDLGKEGGHSTHRVIHHKDQTGYEIERAVLSRAKKQSNIDILDYHFAIDLIVEKNCCLGAYVLDEKNQEIKTLFADYTILATGGIGQVYGHTTNPAVATGDGIAMASRAKAHIEDMEFIQFHPTAVYSKKLQTTFLVSEAVRGFGAYLRTKSGERFMTKYDHRAELASRDIVSQCIDAELKKSGEPCVYIDCTHLETAEFKKHFPMINERCKDAGIDIAKDWIPVAPSQHYVCGGISVNINGQTSIENLFACGECSRTGLHGANRLASNSLLEALVYSHRIYKYLISEKNQKKSTTNPKNILTENPDKKIISSDSTQNIKESLQKNMLRYAGIIRNDKDLKMFRSKLLSWKNNIEKTVKSHQTTKDFYELRNMVEVAILIVEDSLLRNENRGVFIKTYS